MCVELTTLFVQPFQSGRPIEARRKRWSLKRCTGTSCFRCYFCFSVSQGGEKKGTRGEFKMEYNIAPALCSSFDMPSHISLAVNQTTLIYHLNKTDHLNDFLINANLLTWGINKKPAQSANSPTTRTLLDFVTTTGVDPLVYGRFYMRQPAVFKISFPTIKTRTSSAGRHAFKTCMDFSAWKSLLFS